MWNGANKAASLYDERGTLHRFRNLLGKLVITTQGAAGYVQHLRMFPNSVLREIADINNGLGLLDVPFSKYLTVALRPGSAIISSTDTIGLLTL